MTYVPATDADRDAMLEAIGAESIDALMETIPADLRLDNWDVPQGLSEMAVRNQMAWLAGRNAAGQASFLGGGFYDHFIPAAVDALAGRAEFVTAYTPYQPECSQGTLQAIYEYQSAVCRLTGMEVANASLYDGGTAVFEAVAMAVRLTGRHRIVCHSSLNPTYREMLATHAANIGVDIVDGEDPADAACTVVQNPSFLGTVEDFTDMARACHEAGGLMVVAFYPLSLGLLKTPGEMGADIAVGEGQSLGLPLGFGGPYLGIMATRRKYIRKMPGRIGAVTSDAKGRRGFVLTLQTREQHIRREKATSNICTNQSLCALTALAYLSLLGKQGLREVAQACVDRAFYLQRRLLQVPGVRLRYPGRWYFNEFVVELPARADLVIRSLLGRGVAAGFPLVSYYPGTEMSLLVAATEKRTKEEIDFFAHVLEVSL